MLAKLLSFAFLLQLLLHLVVVVVVYKTNSNWNTINIYIVCIISYNIICIYNYLTANCPLNTRLYQKEL